MIDLQSILTKIVPRKHHTRLQRVYFPLLSIWYVGHGVACPICGGQSRKFLTVGKWGAQCPRCGSLQRHRLLWLYLKHKTNFFRDHLKVLDIAPLYFLQEACKKLKNLTYISADLSSPIVMIKMDITDINLPDNQFDCILCYHVLEHILDDEKAMRELFRILKPRGWAILQSPVDDNLDKTIEYPNTVSPEGHVRMYGKDYITRLERSSE